MLNLSFGEIFLVILVSIIFIKPEDMPDFLRKIIGTYRKITFQLKCFIDSCIDPFEKGFEEINKNIKNLGQTNKLNDKKLSNNKINYRKKNGKKENRNNN